MMDHPPLCEIVYLLKSMKSLKLACLLAIAGVGSTSFGQIVVSGDFAAGTGQLAIQQDLTFTITNTVSGSSGYILVFEGMNGGPDAAQTEIATDQNTWLRSINGGANSTVTGPTAHFLFTDRLGGSGYYGDMEPNDSYLRLTSNSESFNYVAATTVTMRAVTFTFSSDAKSGFDSDAMGSFSGNVYLANFATGLRMSDKIAISAVPEPSTYALCGGIAALGLSLWLRRRRAAV